MKFLADVNIEKAIITELTSIGYDVKAVSEINPTMKDPEIIETACLERRILLTNDKDFGELVYNQNKNLYQVIFFRVKGNDITEKINLLKNFLNNYKYSGEKGLFIVIKKGKIIIKSGDKDER